MSLPSLPAVVGGYRLLREIGRGGFGSVHLGEDDDGNRAAVKLLHVAPGTDPRFFELFAREVEAARRVSPFCVAQVLDADPTATQPWIISEYVEGPTLSQAIRRDGPRTGTDLDRLAVSTATALSAIHAAGVVHRDLKPGNILLASDGPRVIDFGIARPFEEATSLTASQVIGTLQYMAPEQLENGARLTPALDVYAWGAVMVFAATGRPVFDAGSQRALVKSVLVDEPDCSALPERLRAVVRRCLSKEPEERPTARELIDLLTGSHDGASDRPEPAARPLAEAPAAPEPAAPARAAPPVWVDGVAHTDPGALAETLAAHWEEALAFLADADLCWSLAAWLADVHGEARVAPVLVETARHSPELALVRLVAALRPDLPPVFRGREMTLAALAARTLSAPGTHVEEGVTADVLAALSDHHCAEPGHGCHGYPCVNYRQLAAEVRSALGAAERAAAVYAPWLTDDRWAEYVDVGRIDPYGPALLGRVLTALLHPGVWHGLVQDAAGVLDGRWAALAPSPVVIGDRGQAAGVEAVHVQVCWALLQCEQAERRQWARLQELRVYRRNRGRDALYAVLALSLGVVLAVLVVDTTGAPSPVLALPAFAAPLALQQCVVWWRRGWQPRQPPAWVVVDTDGADSTALRLTEYAEQSLAALDLARSEFGERVR